MKYKGKTYVEKPKSNGQLTAIMQRAFRERREWLAYQARQFAAMRGEKHDSPPPDVV